MTRQPSKYSCPNCGEHKLYYPPVKGDYGTYDTSKYACYACNAEFTAQSVKDNNAVKPKTLSDRLRDPEQYVDACDEAARVLDDTLTILKKYRQVVKVLGAGVGNLPLTADFFALWNETEISVNLLVKLLEGNKE